MFKRYRATYQLDGQITAMTVRIDEKSRTVEADIRLALSKQHPELADQIVIVEYVEAEL